MKAPTLSKAEAAKLHQPRKPKRACCFKCERPVDFAADLGDGAASWKFPWPAVLFHDGGNFGSTLYDRAMDGVGVDLIVCDNCLVKYAKLIRVTKAVTA